MASTGTSGRGTGRPRLLLAPPGPARVARRYVPLAVVAGAFVLVVALVPSSTRASRGAARSHGQGLAPGITPAEAPGSAGVAVSGARCGPGVRQVPWSKYAPLCVPAYHGDNGGATSPGVTRTTITISYRYAVSPEEQLLYSLVAPSVIGTNQGTIRTMRAYIRELNRTFELYGRHVVLVPYVGKGDFLQEDQGAGVPQAQADAAHAKSLHAFADVSLLASTPPYDEALAHEGIIALGATFMRQAWFRTYAPYEYSPYAPCDALATGGATFLGRALAGLPAIFAGQRSLQTKKRVFGIVYPELPTYSWCARKAVSVLEKSFGVRPARVVGYSPDIGELGQQATNIIAQMKAAGVTTIVCTCDPVSPILLSQDARAQHYFPEWFSIAIADAFSRLPDQSEWAHAIGAGLPAPPRSTDEAYQVFERADPGGAPSPTYGLVYEPLLLLFDAIQAAGPDLTPQSFERGFFSLPTSLPGGVYGIWRFGHDVFAPTASTGLIWWDPTAVSQEDGKRGAWEACNGGAEYGIVPGLPLPAAHTQPQCFGRS